MKKQRLKTSGEQYHDFSIFSLSTTLTDYMLAFKINSMFELKLGKLADLPVYLSGQQPVLFSLYYFLDDAQSEYHLIQDITESDQFINSFLFILRGQFSELKLSEIFDRISNLEDIFSANSFNPEESRSSKNKAAKAVQQINIILTDLEYHMLEINRKNDETIVKLKPTVSRSIRKLYK